MARGFNGTNQHLSTPSDPDGFLSVPFPMAVGLWFKGGAQGNFKYLLSKLRIGGQDASYGLGSNSTGDLRFIVVCNGAVATAPTAPAATGFGSTRPPQMGRDDGAAVRLYVDGVEVGTGTPETATINYNSSPLYLGSFDGTQLYATGSMAEVAIWGSIPDANERAALAKGYSPLLIRPRDLATYWPLIGQYSPEIDIVNSINLTVTGATAADHTRVIQRSRPLWIPTDTVAAGPSIAPDGISVPVALGSPTLTDGSMAVAPDGISVPVALGSPSLSWSASVAPDGISIPVVLGDPALSWSGATAPDGIGIPVELGSPTLTLSGVAPDGINVPVVLGSPTLTWSGTVSPDGISVPVALGAPVVSIPGSIVHRPNTGTTSRPTTGTVTRPYTGITSRP